MMRTNSTPSTPRRAFTLMEMVVVMALVGILLGGLAVIFNRAVTVARSQSDISSMQQGQRIAHQEIGHFLRQAGLGGLPVSWTVTPTDITNFSEDTEGSFPENGFAVQILNSVNTPDSPTFAGAVPGSDVLTVRGSFSSPVYYLSEPLDLASLVGTTRTIKGSAEISTRVNNLYELPVDGFVDTIDGTGGRVPLILRDLANPGAYLVVDFTGDPDVDLIEKDCTSTGVKPTGWVESDDRYTAQCITVDFELDDSAGDAQIKGFGNLSQGTSLEANAGSLQVDLPSGGTRDTLQIPQSVGSIAILEEYTFYLRADREIPGDNSSRLRPVLVRRQTVPGSAGVAGAVLEEIEIVGGLIDLQFAAGIDIHTTIGEAGHGVITESADGTKDEILFNHPDDLDTPPDGFSGDWHLPIVDYHFVRISTLAQTEHPVRDRWAHQLDTLEDHDLKGTFTVGGETESFADDVGYPRTLLQSVIELRNLR